MRFDRYVFICQNVRAEDHPRGSCGHSGGIEILAEFKRLIAENKLRAKVRANKSGCMEVCELGPSIMVHPDNVWYQNVKVEDVAEIVEKHLLGDEPVERLRMDFSRYGLKKM